MTYLCILGRQPELGLAELRRLHGVDNARPFSDNAALVETATLDVEKLGGTVKLGHVIHEIPSGDWQVVSAWLLKHYSTTWRTLDRKQTLGISVYGLRVQPRAVQKLGLSLKSSLKKHDVSLRLIPNQDQALSSAVSHHNKLGLSDNKTELLIVSNGARTIIAESRGAQNITAIAARDQGRPKRDAFVGMLPPKLALLMVNLANPAPHSRILDPFCGTGVVLQEALLLGHDVYGTDLSEKMVDYSQGNLEWLRDKYRTASAFEVHHGDAIETRWQGKIDAVVSELYLGQPFSAPPAPDKLEKVVRICNIITRQFLENLAEQLAPGTPLCLALPSWRDTEGHFTHLPVINDLSSLDYSINPSFENLYYYREDQVVARELLVLTKK